MAGGRSPKLTLVEDSIDKTHRSKDEIEARKSATPFYDMHEDAELECPEHLEPLVKKEWDRLVKLYRKLSIPTVTDLDLDALEAYCVALVEKRKAENHISIEGQVIDVCTQFGWKPTMNPWCTVRNNALNVMKKYSDVLLLDPVSRARVGLAKTKADMEGLSPMAELIKRRKEGTG